MHDPFPKYNKKCEYQLMEINGRGVLALNYTDPLSQLKCILLACEWDGFLTKSGTGRVFIFITLMEHVHYSMS